MSISCFHMPKGPFPVTLMETDALIRGAVLIRECTVFKVNVYMVRDS